MEDELAKRKREKKMIEVAEQSAKAKAAVERFDAGNAEVMAMKRRSQFRVVGEDFTPPPDRSDCD